MLNFSKDLNKNKRNFIAEFMQCILQRKQPAALSRISGIFFMILISYLKKLIVLFSAFILRIAISHDDCKV